jgi:hypothetical protein
MLGPGFRTLRYVKFLFTAPLILAFLFVVNLMTSPGDWWIQWVALGLGIAWFIALIRVVWAIILAGGLAALGVYILNRRAGSTGPAPSQTPTGGTNLPDIPTVPLRRE